MYMCTLNILFLSLRGTYRRNESNELNEKLKNVMSCELLQMNNTYITELLLFLQYRFEVYESFFSKNFSFAL